MSSQTTYTAHIVVVRLIVVVAVAIVEVEVVRVRRAVLATTPIVVGNHIK
jgi:hypothetical protein